MADNKNMVKFGRGTKSMEDFKLVAGYENMVYFNTSTYEIYVGEKKYGFSDSDRALLNSAIESISYDEATAAFTISYVDSTKGDVTFSIPTADTKTPGLMTSDQVAALGEAAAAVLRLEGEGDGSVKKAQADAEAYALGLVEALDLDEVKGEGQAIVSISQVDGKVAAVAGDVAASHVSVADAAGNYDSSNVEEVLAEIAGKISDLDTSAEGVDGKISAAIDELNFNAPSTGGDFVTVTVVQEKGEITSVTVNDEGIASAQSVSDLSDLVGEGFNNSDKTVAKEVARVEALVSTLESSKVDVNAAAIEQEKKDRAEAIEDAVAALEGTLGEDDAKTLAAINDRIDSVSSVADNISYSIEKITEGLGTNVKEAYQLVDAKGDKQGEVINIYKDSALEGVKLTDKNAEEVAGQFLEFTYLTADGGKDVVYVDVSAFLVENEFKNGLEVSTAGEVSVKIASSSESFLTVDGDGVKLSGVQTAIDNAKAAAKSELVNNASEGYQTLKDLEDKIKSAASTAAEHTTVKTGEGHDNELVKVENTKTEGGLEYTITATNIAKASDLTALTNKVGEPVNGTLAQDIVDAKQATTDLANGDVADNKAAIALLNNTEETEGSVKHTAKGYADAAEEAALNAAKTYTDEALYWYEG